MSLATYERAHRARLRSEFGSGTELEYMAYVLGEYNDNVGRYSL